MLNKGFYTKIVCCIVFFWIKQLLSANITEEMQIKQQLEISKAVKNLPTQIEIVNNLKTALNYIKKFNYSILCSKYYQRMINNFSKIPKESQQQINIISYLPELTNIYSFAEINQEILKLNDEELKEINQLQQKEQIVNNINNYLSKLSQQQNVLCNGIDLINKNLRNISSKPITFLTQSQIFVYRAIISFNKAELKKIKLVKLFINHRKELASIKIESHIRKLLYLNHLLQSIINKFSSLLKYKSGFKIHQLKNLMDDNLNFLSVTNYQLSINYNLLVMLNKQSRQISQLNLQQYKITNNIIRIKQTLDVIKRQSQWLSISNILAEALRARVARLPEISKIQLNNNEIIQYQVQHIYYEDLREQQQKLKNNYQNSKFFSKEQMHVLNSQFYIQSKLLNDLIIGNRILISESIKINIKNNQLINILNKVREATNRYLFWTADVRKVNINTFLDIIRDLYNLISFRNLKQFSEILLTVFTNRMIIIFIGTLSIAGCILGTKKQYYQFLNRSASKVGKVTQDRFSLTLYTVFWSILIALPLPIMWKIIGYELQHAWHYPVIMAIGDGINSTFLLLWCLIIGSTLARPNGLFIAHFRWSQNKVLKAIRYQYLNIGLIVPLITLLNIFNNLDNKKFYATLGRLCFILICCILSIVTINFKRTGIVFHFNGNISKDNLLNIICWNSLIVAPLIAALASCIGYLATSQALLVRLEDSIAVWFVLLIIYHIIRRWMLIQRRRIAFDRARQRRSEILSARAKGEDMGVIQFDCDVDDTIIDLDVISNQSLKLIRSLLKLVALALIIMLWSKINFAFGFLENINIWKTNTTVQGIKSMQCITLGSLLISVLVLVVTILLVRNMPALLELAILQHLDLNPGTGYAITTISKYLLICIGSLVGFSFIGVDWIKLQWLFAAMGLGLGFGLQQIFANFISGLIILFEKPIRIGDTVTLRDFTGNVTRINTRAITITDWDRKEIIVPNQAFITEQFINWSLSDSITRVVLNISAVSTNDTNKIVEILLKSTRKCKYVLNVPKPEVFLVDIYQGIQLFELRIYAAEISHRMPLRHDLLHIILEEYKKHGFEMPFPPVQIKINDNNTYKVNNSTNRCNKN